MSNYGNDVGLDQIRACVIAPDTSRIPSDLAHEIGFGGQTMDIGPLLDNFLRIPRIDDGVGAAVPDGEPWPRSAVRRCRADEIAPLFGQVVGSLRHGFEG